MEKTYKPDIDMWALDTDASHILHRIGADDYTEIRHTHVKPSELDAWEELAVEDIPPYTKAEYDAKVNELVRRRYSESEEFAIQRKLLNVILSPQPLIADADTEAGTELTDGGNATEEYAAYNAYVEQCKADAPAAIAREKAAREAEEAEENADTNA